MLAVHLDEIDGEPHVVVRSTRTGQLERMTADRIFVACGGIGTTRLVLGSLGVFDQAVYLQESVQFVMPTVSMRPVARPPSLPGTSPSTSSICSTTSPARVSISVRSTSTSTTRPSSHLCPERSGVRAPNQRWRRCCGGSQWVSATCRDGGHRG